MVPPSDFLQRISVHGGELSGGQSLKAAVARIKRSVRTFNGKEAVAGESHVQGVAGHLDTALGEIRPLPLDYRQRGTGAAGGRIVGIRRGEQAVEFLVPLISIGGRIGQDCWRAGRAIPFESGAR